MGVFMNFFYLLLPKRRKQKEVDRFFLHTLAAHSGEYKDVLTAAFEKINNLPGECDSLPDGFLLKIYGDCFSPDWEKEDDVINHLGREYIADIKTFYKENNLIPLEEKGVKCVGKIF